MPSLLAERAARPRVTGRSHLVHVSQVDLLFSRGAGKGHEHEATSMLKAQFLALWDGLLSPAAAHRPVIVVAATNRVAMVDGAVLRRPTFIQVAVRMMCVPGVANGMNRMRQAAAPHLRGASPRPRRARRRTTPITTRRDPRQVTTTVRSTTYRRLTRGV